MMLAKRCGGRRREQAIDQIGRIVSATSRSCSNAGTVAQMTICVKQCVNVLTELAVQQLIDETESLDGVVDGVFPLTPRFAYVVAHAN
jgi:hypothetical protein